MCLMCVNVSETYSVYKLNCPNCSRSDGKLGLILVGPFFSVSIGAPNISLLVSMTFCMTHKIKNLYSILVGNFFHF